MDKYINFVKNHFKGRFLSNLNCKFCQKNCEFSLYHNSMANAVAYFLKAINNTNNPKQQDFLDAIQNPVNSSLFDPKIELISEFKNNKDEYNVKNTGPFCKHLS